MPKDFTLPTELSDVKQGRSIHFRVYGPAVPQGSKTGFVIPGTKRVVLKESGKGHKDWRRAVSQTAGEVAETENWVPLDGPVMMEIIIYKTAPKTPKWKAEGLPDTRPDADKLARSIDDACEGILYTIDSKITDLFVQKRFGLPGAFVRCTELLELANPKS